MRQNISRLFVLACLCLLPLSVLAQSKSFEKTPEEMAVLKFISNYFSAIPAFEARFLQINPTGDTASGVMLYQKPNRLLFRYDAPNTLKVAVIGTTLYVQEKNGEQPDTYPVDATPLPLFFSSDLNLQSSAMVAGMTRTQTLTEILLEDPEGKIGGKLYMNFNAPNPRLRGWRVVDAQGQIITLLLRDLRIVDKIDESRFALDYKRKRGPKR